MDTAVNVHNLKTLSNYFEDIKKGIKNFEVRKNDRGFEVGDTLILEEIKDGKYTGRWIPKRVTYKLDDKEFVKEGFVILGMVDIKF